jgi:hypothetical protein
MEKESRLQNSFPALGHFILALGNKPRYNINANPEWRSTLDRFFSGQKSSGKFNGHDETPYCSS